MAAKRTRRSKVSLPVAVELRKNLSANAKRLRLKNGLTQEQLADLVNISRDYIGEIEREVANVSLDVLNQLAIHLGVSPLDLIKSPRPPK